MGSMIGAERGKVVLDGAEGEETDYSQVSGIEDQAVGLRGERGDVEALTKGLKLIYMCVLILPGARRLEDHRSGS